MRGIAIYLEGGGDTTSGKAALRKGMGEFLRALRNDVRRHGLRWKIVACGSRNAAFEAFQYVVDTEPDTFNMLLVDSEDAVVGMPVLYLQQREGWSFKNNSDDHVHLMVRTMETWIVADAESLAKYYGQGFHKNVLPRAHDLETVDKSSIANALMKATIHTQKGEYHKIRHASDLLACIDAKKVRSRCKHCERLFDTLQALVTLQVIGGM